MTTSVKFRKWSIDRKLYDGRPTTIVLVFLLILAIQPCGRDGAPVQVPRALPVPPSKHDEGYYADYQQGHSSDDASYDRPDGLGGGGSCV